MSELSDTDFEIIGETICLALRKCPQGECWRIALAITPEIERLLRNARADGDRLRDRLLDLIHEWEALPKHKWTTDELGAIAVGAEYP